VKSQWVQRTVFLAVCVSRWFIADALFLYMLPHTSHAKRTCFESIVFVVCNLECFSSRWSLKSSTDEKLIRHRSHSNILNSGCRFWKCRNRLYRVLKTVAHIWHIVSGCCSSSSKAAPSNELLKYNCLTCMLLNWLQSSSSSSSSSSWLFSSSNSILFPLLLSLSFCRSSISPTSVSLTSIESISGLKSSLLSWLVISSSPQTELTFISVGSWWSTTSMWLLSSMASRYSCFGTRLQSSATEMSSSRWQFISPFMSSSMPAAFRYILSSTESLSTSLSNIMSEISL